MAKHRMIEICKSDLEKGSPKPQLFFHGSDSDGPRRFPAASIPSVAFFPFFFSHLNRVSLSGQARPGRPVPVSPPNCSAAAGGDHPPASPSAWQP